MTLKKLILLCTIAVLAQSCGKPPAESAPTLESPVATPEAPHVVTQAAAGTATVSGQVLFEGTPPVRQLSAVKSFTECSLHHTGDVYTEHAVVNDGKVQHAFIYIKGGLEGKSFETPATEVLLDQVGCIYKPHVLGIQTGQTLLVKNSDVSLHNVHSFPKINPSFNLGMPVQGMKLRKKFDQAEVMIPLKCDVHPWMQSFIGVLPHPYFAVTDAAGNFEIKNLPEGTYTIEAWHETFGTQTQSVTVGPTDSQQLTFTYK